MVSVALDHKAPVGCYIELAFKRAVANGSWRRLRWWKRLLVRGTKLITRLPFADVDDVIHVEIALSITCTPPCPYCTNDRAYGARPYCHRLSYTVAADSESGVSTLVDRHYDGVDIADVNEWVAYRYNDITAAEYTRVKSFLDAQLGKPFNTKGFFLNFAFSACSRSNVTGERLRCWNVGLPYDADIWSYNTGAARWFCSELASAALQNCLSTEGISPSTVSPMGLYCMVYMNKAWSRRTAVQSIV